MPFDQSNQISYERSTLSTLARQADEALEKRDRAKCIGIVNQIYELLDLSSAAYIVRAAKPGMGASTYSTTLRNTKVSDSLLCPGEAAMPDLP